MRAHVGAVVVKELVVDPENATVFGDRGPDPVALLARMIGGNQMFAPVFDPLDRLSELQRGCADKHIFRVHFPANAEASADVALIELHLIRMPAKHERQPVSVPVRHLGGAMHLQNIIGLVVARDGAARLHRDAAVPADRKIKCDDRIGCAKGGVDVAGFLFDHRCFGIVVLVERPGLPRRIENDRQRLDVNLDQIGRVLGNIWIGSEDRRHWLPDITHVTLRQRGLPVGLELHEPGQAKSYRRNVGDVGMRPDGVNAWQCKGSFYVDRFQSSVRYRRAHHTHMPLAGK